MERKRLQVNMGKTNFMVSGPQSGPEKSGKGPCGISKTDVGRNAIFCGGSLS